MAPATPPPTHIWATKLKQAQEASNEAARLEFSKDYNAAFAAYLRTGEAYLWLLRNFELRTQQQQQATDGDGAEQLKARLRRAAAKVLERAELIKNLKKNVVPPARDLLDADSQAAILRQSSAVGHHRFPLWPCAGPAAEHGPLYQDPDGQPALAASHLERRAHFRRAAQTNGEPALINYEAPLRGRDIVQDVVTDCSFVAALQVAAEYDRRWNTKIATAALHPRDEHDRACSNPCGKYAVKLHFNGGARQVLVDDMLPCFPDGTLIGAASVRNDQFWPALVEKAFLKVMGGYDFPGSNSAADLHTLTGWLPEQILLQQAGFRREQTWRALHAAFSQGRCILTVGTGAGAEKRSKDPSWKWLSPAHNYAVLDVREHEGHRQMVVVNSWRRAPRASGVTEQQNGDDGMPGDVSQLADSAATLSLYECESDAADEVHVLSWEDVCVRFDTIHVNWRLSDFPHFSTVHCTWNSRKDQSSLSQNTQLQIVFDWDANRRADGAGAQAQPQGGDEGEELWLHLNRHMSGRLESESALIAVHAFNHAEGRKLYQLTDREQLGAFTDSSHALHKMRIRRDCSAVTVVASQLGVDRETPFSLSAHCNVPMSIRALPRAYPYRVTTSGSWSGRSAGGNLAQPTFGFNPQYVLEIEPSKNAQDDDASLLIMAESARMMPLQVMLVHSNGGQRVEQVEEAEVIMSSGMYTHAVAMAERVADGTASNAARGLRNGVVPGKYTLIVSTFAPAVDGDFVLTVEASHRLAPLRPIPQEGAGMFHRALRGCWSIEQGTAVGGPMGGGYGRNPSWKVVVPAGGATVQMRLRLDSNQSAGAGCSFVLRPDGGYADASGCIGPNQARVPLNLAIFSLSSEGVDSNPPSAARRPDAKVVISAMQAPALPRASEVTSSGPYADRLHGVTIARRRLEAGEYVLVASTFKPGQEASFVVECWSETSLEVR
ncbi:cysteine protease [Tilletia horrida]|nr:cysteine protease [Tilletia horrida]